MADKPLVWIATPLKELEVDGVLTQEIFESLAPHYRDQIKKLIECQTLPWRFDLCVTGGGNVACARNTIVAEFLKSDANLLFFVDYDLMPDWTDFVQVLRRDLPVCGGTYTTREKDGRWVLNRLNGASPTEDGLIPVLELGGGFKCYKRSVFEKVAVKNPWLLCDIGNRKKQTAFFAIAPARDEVYWPGVTRFLTEDYWLDWLCRDAGILVVADLNVRLKHWDNGNIYPDEFPVDVGQLPDESKEP